MGCQRGAPRLECKTCLIQRIISVTYSPLGREGLLKLRMALPHLRWRLKAPSVPVAGLLEQRHDHVTPAIRTRYRHALCPTTASELLLHIHTSGSYRGDLQRIACDRHSQPCTQGSEGIRPNPHPGQT